MSESDKEKEVLRLALENEARILIEGDRSESYRVLERYEEELAQEAYRIGIKVVLSDEDREILRQSREASIILDNLRRKHVPVWQWISIILSIVPGVLLITLVFKSMQNMWLRILSAVVAIVLLFVLCILLSVYCDEHNEKRKAFYTMVVRLYFVEKWTQADIAKECGISQRQLRKILHRYVVELDE